MNDRQLLEIQLWVKTQVSPLRFRHIQGVAATSRKLALRYRLPVGKALLAAWLHDCGKELTRGQMKAWLKKSRWKLDREEEALPGLWHPHVGAAIAALQWGVRDQAVLEAVRCHTLGRPGMGPLARLLFVADFIEPGRRFSGVAAARKSALQSLGQGVLAKASQTIGFLLQKKMAVHPRLVATWNYFLRQEVHENQ